MIAYFYHKTTGVPLVGGTVTMTLVNAQTNSIVVNAGSMSEVTNLPGAYYNSYQPDAMTDYIGKYTCTDSNYVSSVDKIYLPASRSGGGGGGSVDLSGVQNGMKKYHDNILKEVKKYIEDAKEEIMNQEEKEMDFSSIIDKIESIEFPEQEIEKVDLTPINKKLVNFQKDIGDIKLGIENAIKNKESEWESKEKEISDKFEIEKSKIYEDANEIIKILEDENIKVKESIKNKIISSFFE